MRAPERIKPIVTFFNENPKVFKEFLGDDVTPAMFDIIFEGLPLVRKEWLKCPDQRLGQLLANMGLIGFYNSKWYTEEVGWLVDNNHMKFEEVTFWGVNYFKNGKRRAKTKYVALKYLKDDHIANILEHVSTNGYGIRKDYRDYFQKRLSSIKES